MRLFWVTLDGPKSSKCPEEKTQPPGRMPHEDGGRDWRGMATARERLGPPKREEARKHPPLESLEGSWPRRHLNFRLWPPEWRRNKYLLFLSHKAHGDSLRQPWKQTHAPSSPPSSRLFMPGSLE